MQRTATTERMPKRSRSFLPRKSSVIGSSLNSFQIHDPTTLNRQGNDRGTSYRSAIFYTSEDQERIAKDTIVDIEASGLWPGKVVTEITQAGPFWEAEPEQ
jgi:peptide-methionine (S)-S-oxide reductase